MTTVRDLMSTDVVSVAPDLSLRAAVELFATRHLGGAPVMAGSRLVGVITASDILAFQSSTPAVPTIGPEPSLDEEEAPDEWGTEDQPTASFFSELWPDAGADVLERFETTAGPEWDNLAEHTVSEAMSRRFAEIGPDAAARTAARLMTRLGVHRLLVVEDGALCGVLSSMDLVRAVAERRV